MFDNGDGQPSRSLRERLETVNGNDIRVGRLFLSWSDNNCRGHPQFFWWRHSMKSVSFRGKAIHWLSVRACLLVGTLWGIRWYGKSRFDARPRRTYIASRAASQLLQAPRLRMLDA